MVLLILLIASLILQVVAAVIALRLTRKTKFNAAWMLFSAAIILISYLLVVELITVWKEKPTSYMPFSLWSTIILSFCIAIGIFYVRKIINYIESINRRRELTERRLLNTIIYTEEKERQRYSKDIHDGLGPLLSSAKMSLSVLAKGEHSPKAKGIIGNASYAINEAIKEVKDISNNISPTILQNFGISRAINNFVSKVSVPEGIDIKYNSIIKDRRFNGNVEVVFYRIGCELINNAIKHSNADKITIGFDCWGSNLVLTVEDNGIGFSKDIIESNLSGMGLKNIISRVNSLSGNVEFIRLNRGIKITVSVKV